MDDPSGHPPSSAPLDPARSGQPGQPSRSGQPGQPVVPGRSNQPSGDLDHSGDACARAWVAWRAIHATITEALTDDLGREFGLALTEFEVLTALQPRPAQPAQPAPVELRLGDLGRYVALSQPAISRLVTRLEERGLVRRLDGAADRRSVLVAATPAGIALYGRAAPVHAAAVGRHLTGHLTDADQEALVTLITRLHSASRET